MEITLNSPKYAEAQSLQYQMYKKQKDRKKRKNFMPELFERYFRRNEGTTDYATIPEVTLTGDYAISLLLLPNLSASTFRVFGNSSNFSNRLSVFNDGAINFRTSSGAGGELQSPAGSVVGNQFSFIEISSINNMVTISVNNSIVVSGDTGVGDLVVDQLYRQSTTSEGSGILANLSIYDAGTLIRDYPLDDNSGILANRATPLGPELYLFNGLNNWSSARSNSTLSLDGENVRVTANNTATHGGAWQLDGLTIGSQILVNITMLRGTSTGQIRIRADSTPSLTEGQLVEYTNPNDGSITAIVNATASTMYFGTISTGHAAGQYHEILINSIRQADGYGTVINGNASDWGLFQQQATGEWLGQELWTDGIVGSLAPLTILSDSLGVYSEGLSYLYMNNVGLLNANDGTGFNQVSGSTFVRTSSGAIAVRNMSPSESALNFTPSVKEVLNVA